MKVTLNWLKQYVDFDGSPADLAGRLTMLGLEVEGIERLGGEFDGIVVAEVITRERHPNADKLSVCRVNDGKGERQIVCGAQNFKPGDKVPLILPGASLPAKPGEPPFTIKVGKIRGVESHGMMCSPQELGLATEADGLLILSPDARVGQPFAEYLGRAGSDVVYDLEVTPNRPDLNSVIGIAREIAAVTGNPLRLPPVDDFPRVPGQPAAEDLVAVRIEDPALCPRYTARVVRGVKIGPSPDWLRTALEKVGLRSINNVVDVTNFVMLECGQPLHAFDYHLVAAGAGGKPTIVVRRARDGEEFVTLDGQKRVLTGEMLLIADEQKGIALAGVMGGQNSEINAATTDVLIESAYFQPTNVRRTAKALGLRTDASYRFERGADWGITEWASRRCAQLILQVAGGAIVPGVVDACPQPFEPRQISLRHHKVSELLGVPIPPAEIEFFLGQLGLKITGRKARPVDSPADSVEPVTFRIPSWRVDLKREVDLIEEVCRLYGVDRIPATPPRGATGSNAFDAVHDDYAGVRHLLTGLGLDEAQGQTLVAEDVAALVAGANDLVRLANPLSADMNVLRPSLLPGLLDSLRHNLSRQNADLALFEVGRVFHARGAASPRESRRLALALTGRRFPRFWTGDDREALVDAYDLKGVLEELFDHLGLRGVAYARRAENPPFFIESAALSLGGKVPLGEMGQLCPTLAKRFDLRQPVFLAELDLDQLLARRNPTKSFKPLPAFPSIRRDVAMLVPEATTHGAVLEVVRQTRPRDLESVELFDVFRGRNVPPGQKSVAYAFTYRAADRTLTDAEVNATHDQVVAQLKQRLAAVIRDS
ncbi:MAG: phenylalanine--tRNA ligase subunit beta [Verrucomicrobia bacterium]|nr:phenylalanine--tRNA ligase subunit beta [Verrucomicrobiota bacterium]